MFETKKITILASMAALSLVLITLINVPILPSAVFLRYDPGDVPIILVALLFKYKDALLVAAVVALVQGILLSYDGGIIGILMHFIATSSFLIVAKLIYTKKNYSKNLMISLLGGSIAMIISMVLLNLIAIPIFLGVSIEMVYDMLVPIIIPFNIIKTVINCILIWIAYKPISKYINKSNIGD